MKHNPLLEELRLAFPPRPIRAEGAFEQRGIAYCDADDYMLEMEGKTWEQMDPQFFARRSDGLSFLSDTHIVEVLPLYLHLLLVFRPTSPVPETLLPLLTRPEPTDKPENLYGWRKKRFEGVTSLLTETQKQVVARTLDHFVTAAPDEARWAEPAIERYWGQFA